MTPIEMKIVALLEEIASNQRLLLAQALYLPARIWPELSAPNMARLIEARAKLSRATDAAHLLREPAGLDDFVAAIHNAALSIEQAKPGRPR
jgi:hypothetical protein